MSSAGVERDNVCRCVFKGPKLGDLAVPERVEVCPLLLERAARGLDEIALVTHDGQIIAMLDPDTRAYFTEEMEDGASEYYFDGYGATVERVSITEVEEE